PASGRRSSPRATRYRGRLGHDREGGGRAGDGVLGVSDGRYGKVGAMDLLDLFERASDWTGSKVPAAAKRLDDPTPCDEWDVRTLLNHLIDAQRYFIASAKGEEAPPPSAQPPALIGDDPVRTYQETCQQMLDAYRQPGVLEKG